MLTCGPGWMSVEQPSIITYRAEHFLTKLLWRPTLTPGIRDACIDRNGKKTCCIWSACGPTFKRVAGSVVFAAMVSFAWEAIPTTLESMLPISVWLFALMLILSRFSANLKEVKKLFGCQLKG